MYDILFGTYTDWGDVATWVGGIGTTLAFILAFAQLIVQRRKEQKQKESAQSELISSWVSDELHGKSIVTILNVSANPVYQVILKLANFGHDLTVGEEWDYTRCIAILPPGRSYTVIEGDYHGMNFFPSIQIAFVDSAGKSWLRKSNGLLGKSKQLPHENYGFSLPLPWTFPLSKKEVYKQIRKFRERQKKANNV